MKIKLIGVKKMLTERFNDKTNKFECFDSELEYCAFMGFGDTKEQAKINYFSISITKNPTQVISLAPCA